MARSKTPAKNKPAPALRSSHPTVVEWWDSYVAEHERWHKACRRLIRKLAPFPKAKGMILNGFSTIFAGYEPTTETARNPPEGWRLDRKNWMLVPHRSTPEGKRIVAEMAKLGKLPDPRLHIPGLPMNVMSLPGIAKYGDEVWIEFSHPSDAYDATLWTPARLSEFHAAKEAATDDRRGELPE